MSKRPAGYVESVPGGPLTLEARVYRLTPGWDFVREGEKRLLFFDEERSFAVRARIEVIDGIASCLGQPHSPAPSCAIYALEQLRVRGSVTAAARPDDRGQFSRQLEYFTALTERPDRAQRRLESSSVLILGMGGTGGEFLRLMVAAGIRSYAFVDKDVVELSNLNRQTIYTLNDVGRPKVRVCEQYVGARLSPNRCATYQTSVETARDVIALAEEVNPDLTLIAIDEPKAEVARMAAEALHSCGFGFLIAGVGVRHGRSYPISTAMSPDAIISGTTASIGTTNAISAAYAAHTALQYLAGVSMPFRMHHAP